MGKTDPILLPLIAVCDAVIDVYDRYSYAVNDDDISRAVSYLIEGFGARVEIDWSTVFDNHDQPYLKDEVLD